MGMNVRIKVCDLLVAVEHLTELAFDNTAAPSNPVVRVHYGSLVVIGDQWEGVATFGRSQTHDVIRICTSIGIPFEYL